MTMSSPAESSRTLSYAEAVFEATRSEMARDPKVFVMGQGVDDARGMFGTTLGLHKEFGAERNFDVPLAEDAMTGVGIGAAMMGMRPIQVHQRMDFVLLCMNQIVNMASKMSYMFSGAHRVPLVIRAIIGRSWGQGAQHSQAFHSYFMHVPGLRVVAPTTPHDAKGCLITAIRDDNPVIMIEHRMLHNVRGVVPQASYEIAYGKARVLSPGKDITIVGISHMALECVRAKHLLEAANIDAEVIDPVSLSPLDSESIARSVERTGRLLVVDTGWLSCGASSEILSEVFERIAHKRPFAAKRLGYLPTPCPTTKVLENLYYPSPQSIAQAAYQLVRGADAPLWQPGKVDSSEVAEFRGPF
jgi:acetoin:2,6-dichlorophenolindophenol oxidoreductase subunit beta